MNDRYVQYRRLERDLAVVLIQGMPPFVTFEAVDQVVGAQVAFRAAEQRGEHPEGFSDPLD